MHLEEPWGRSEARAEVPALDPNSRRNRWNWCGDPEAHRYRQLKAVCRVFSEASDLGESESRWDLKEGSVKT